MCRVVFGFGISRREGRLAHALRVTHYALRTWLFLDVLKPVGRLGEFFEEALLLDELRRGIDQLREPFPKTEPAKGHEHDTGDLYGQRT